MTGTPSDNGERRSSDRRSFLLWLAGFVAVVGGVSWLLTDVGRHGTPPTHSPAANVTPGPTPTPLDCPPNELALVGAFNECAKSFADASSTCSVSGHILEMVLRLTGTSPDASFLYIEVSGAFAGPAASYALPPWPHPLGTQGDVPKVAVQQDGTSAFLQLVGGVPVQRYDTDAFWQSVAGIRRQRQPVGNGVRHPRTVCRQRRNGAGFDAQPEWAVELFLTSGSVAKQELPGDGVEPSVHGFTDRCLDHLATLGCKGFGLVAGHPYVEGDTPTKESRVWPRCLPAEPANSSQDNLRRRTSAGKLPAP
jgi:hypothetical protein